MSTLPLEHRVRVAAALADGVSMHGVARLTGVTRQTIAALLLKLGDGAARVHATHMQNLTADVLEFDEVWAFVGTKESNRDDFDPEEFGDAYTFVAQCATSRAVVSHLTDKRTGAAATVFSKDVRARVLGKPQITSDGLRSYTSAIEEAFGTRVHYAQNLKTYALDEAGGASRDDVRYSRGRCIASQKIKIIGSPDESKITTAHIERNNLTTRLWNRRLTRLTPCFSRRLVFLRASMAWHFAVYNFVRVQEVLRVTPAMQLGVTDRLWSMEELVVAALDALDRPTPAVPPPVPPTPAVIAGASTLTARRAARRSAARRAPTPVVFVPGAPTADERNNESEATQAMVAAPQETTTTTDTPTPEAPRDTFPAPPDAASDFRWMW